MRERIRRGQGPLRIRLELQRRGAAEDVIDRYLTQPGGFWIAQARQVRQRRFGDMPPAQVGERGRQLRFLLQRGFPADVVSEALAPCRHA